MSDAPEELTIAMQERAQAALSFYGDSRSTGDVENRHLRALVLRHECEINPPSDAEADHNIRAVTLTDWFPGVLEAGVDAVEEPEVRPKRSFFKKKTKDSQAEASSVEAPQTT
jgi:hypothetical protein